MSDTFISIKEAIGQIDITFSTNDNAGVIGYIMRKYKLLDLPLYQIDNKLQQTQQTSPIVSELFYDYLSEKYPPKPTKKEITRDLLPNITHPFIQKYTKEPFDLSEYFWQANDFESCIAPILPTPKNNPVFPTTSTPTPANNDKLATLQTQLDQAHARIAELEKVVEQSKTATTPIFDSQNSYTYPPELDMAIKIWLEIYQTDNIPKHLTNHSDKFTQACKNLGFAFTENAIETRLKKVTTPQSQKEKTKNKNSLK